MSLCGQSASRWPVFPQQKHDVSLALFFPLLEMVFLTDFHSLGVIFFVAPALFWVQVALRWPTLPQIEHVLSLCGQSRFMWPISPQQRQPSPLKRCKQQARRRVSETA